MTTTRRCCRQCSIADCMEPGKATGYGVTHISSKISTTQHSLSAGASILHQNTTKDVGNMRWRVRYSIGNNVYFVGHSHNAPTHTLAHTNIYAVVERQLRRYWLQPPRPTHIRLFFTLATGRRTLVATTISCLFRVLSHLPKAISVLPCVSFFVGIGYISAAS